MRINKKGVILVGIVLTLMFGLVACSNTQQGETEDAVSEEQNYEELCELAIAKAAEGDYESAVAYIQEARILSKDEKALELDYTYRKEWAAEQLKNGEVEGALENYRYLRGIGGTDIDEEIICGEVEAHLSMGNVVEAMDVIDFALKYAENTEPYKEVKQDIIDNTVILKKIFCYIDGTEIPDMVEEYSYDKKNFMVDSNGMEYYYDENGNCIKMVQIMDEQILYTIEMEYDYKGDKVSQRYLDADGQVTSSSTYTYEYDADDRLLSAWEHNALLLSEPIEIEKCTYDQTGALVEYWTRVEKPEMGYYGFDHWYYDYDENNRIYYSTYENGMGETYSEVYEYDKNGYLVKTERKHPDGKVNTWYYDSFGNCIQADGETYKYEYMYVK